MTDPLLVLLGLVIGLLIGFTGMGGGALMAPALMLWFGVPPVVAVGTDLAYSAVTKAFGAALHLKRRNVEVGLAVRLAAGSVPGALLAVAVSQWLKAGGPIALDFLIRKSVGVILVFVGALILVQLFRRNVRSATAPVEPSSIPAWLRHGLDIAAAGAIGFLVGLTSIGSGSLVVAWLSLRYVMPGRLVVGTDLFNAFLLTAAGGLAHLHAGNVDPGLMVSLLLGSVPGILIGTTLTLSVPNAVLRGSLALMLLTIGIHVSRT